MVTSCLAAGRVLVAPADGTRDAFRAHVHDACQGARAVGSSDGHRLQRRASKIRLRPSTLCFAVTVDACLGVIADITTVVSTRRRVGSVNAWHTVDAARRHAAAVHVHDARHPACACDGKLACGHSSHGCRWLIHLQPGVSAAVVRLKLHIVEQSVAGDIGGKREYHTRMGSLRGSCSTHRTDVILLCRCCGIRFSCCPPSS